MASAFAVGNDRCLSKAESLQHCALLKLLDHIPQFLTEITRLPASLKNKIFFLMLKRGLVTDQNIVQLLSDKIRVLDLKDCNISDYALSEIAKVCRYLQKIDLNSLKDARTTITSEGLVTLAQGCPNLQAVYLRRCINVTDEAIVQLSKSCRCLRELNIGGCPLVTDESLSALGENCSCLSSIDFSKANVTDDGVISLVQGACAECLKEIHLDGCVHVTDDSVEAIVQFCPNISVLLFHGCPNTSDRSRLALEEIPATRSKMTHLTWTIY